MIKLRERFTQRRKMGKKGFTLVELIIVIVMLVALAAIAIPGVSSYLDKAVSAKVLSNGRTFYTALSAEAANAYAEGTEIDEDSTDILITAAKNVSKVPDKVTIKATISDGAVGTDDFEYTENGYTVSFDNTSGNMKVVIAGTPEETT